MLKESEDRNAAKDDYDLQIELAVRQQLAISGHCGLRHLQVRIERDLVQLVGEVSTYFLKQTAQEVTRVVCPEYQINNSIVVHEPKAGTFPGSR